MNSRENKENKTPSHQKHTRGITKIDKHIAKRFYYLRTTILNITQQDLADQLGITFQQVQKYEKGSNKISSGRLWDISEIGGVTPSFFYEGLQSSREIIYSKSSASAKR